MDILYPSTKFYIPRPRKNIVRRQRLFGRLNAGIDNKLISVCAPAGYGKTTLVTSWLASLEMPIGWVSADEGDNDIYRFCVCLLESLREHNLLGGDKLRQMLQSAAPPTHDSLATLFLAEIAGLHEDCILVIDDYHLITNPAVHTILHWIIEQSAPQLHFVICSRTELPFSIARMRAQSELVELSQHELSLTLEETGLYMNMVMGSGLKAADLAVLHERTEGWLVGLQLAALSLRDQKDARAFIDNLKGDNRYIADYLIDEVLAHIPADLQDFLLRTSILKEMDAPLCNFVLQIDNSQDMLESLDRKRLFTIPLDEIRQSYRYHHLFREMLFDRLQRKSAPVIKSLYQSASTWFSLRGPKETAIDYALAADDVPAVLALLKDIGPQMLYRGNWTQVLSWYDKLPESAFLNAPELWLIYLMTLINGGAIARASQQLDKMEAEDLGAKSLPAEEQRRIGANLAAVRGVVHLHSRADSVASRESLAIARQQLPAEVNTDLVFAEFNYGAACLHAGDYQEARAALDRSVEWAKQANVTLGVLIGMSYCAQAISMSGDSRTAHELLQTAVRYANEWGLQEGAVFAKTNLELGCLCYEWNQLELAEQYLTQGIRLAEQGGYLDQLLPGYLHLMRVQFLRGNLAGTNESMNCLRGAVEKYGDPPIALAFLDAARADLALLQGELGIANRWAERYQPLANHENTLFTEYQQTVLARVVGHSDHSLKMCEILLPIRERAASSGRFASVIACDVMTAKCLFMHGEPEPALEILETALCMGESGQFVRTFLDEGGVVISMIKQLLTAHMSSAPEDCKIPLQYLHRLLDEAAKDTLKASTAQHPSGSVAGLESLTSQELNILRLLEAGYTNKQISSELNVSLNTVKYHLKNVYGKMGVVNRTQASRALRDKD